MNTIKLIFVLGAVSLISQVYSANIDFWKIQRRGANCFSNVPKAERFRDAKKMGISVMRITPSKWLNGRHESKMGNFLIGPKDAYVGLIKKDLDYLVTVLGDAHKAGIKIVLTLLSLPGSRWSQHNIINGKRVQQLDLWKDFKYHKQAADVWQNLAKRLNNHPAVVGYNILNEPVPELVHPKLRDWYTGDYKAWHKKIKGTAADLNVFYKTVIAAIRKEDQDTPIIVDTGFYATPYGIQILNPKTLNDPNLIYAMHHYIPYRYIGNGNTGYAYGDKIPIGELDVKGEKGSHAPYAPLVVWDKTSMKSFYAPVLKWIEKFNIPSNRIFVSEFGAHRTTEGIVSYFKDAIQMFDALNWHWAFYAFREDDGYPPMDYELGLKSISKDHPYWTCAWNYSCAKKGLYKPHNSLWNVIQAGLKGTNRK